MLSFDVFNSPLHAVISGVILMILWVATLCANSLKIVKGLQLLSGAVFLIVITSLVQTYLPFFYEYAVSAKVLALAEMMLVLIGTILAIMASSYILINKPLNQSVLIGFVSVGLGLIVYTIFVANDANLLTNMRQVLPIIGLSYVFLSFVSKPKIWKYPAELVAALSLSGLIFLMMWPMFFEYKYPWFLPLDLILLLAFAYFLLIWENEKNNLTVLKEKYRRLNHNIGTIIKSSPFPIVISRLSDDALLMVNQNALKLFGISEDEVSRYHFRDFFVDAENRKLLLDRLEQNKEVHDFEILVKTAAGNTPFWLLASVNVIDYNNDVVLYAAFQDITARKRRETMLQSQADRDPLTAVFNRRYFETKVAEKIGKAHENKEDFAILMIDADNFKNVNDTYGHKIGDKVLIELASVCEHSLRQDDLVARYGGEEFVVFLAKVTPSIAKIVANRLREAIAQIVVYADDGQPVSFTVSIGVAPSGISDNASVMIKMADDAMYLAKQNGRNRVEIFEQDIVASSHAEVDDKTRLMHPVFAKESSDEISLLDGPEASHMIED